MQRAITNQTIIGLIVVHLAIVLPLAFSLNIWSDEASSLYTTQPGFFSAFHNAATNEKQAPLYFWILSVWRELNDSIFFARLFSIICSVAAIVVFARLCSRLLEPRAALLTSAFFALHPFLFFAGLEIRSYSMVILLSIILIRLFFDGFIGDKENGRRSSQIGLVFAATIALYTHYYLGFLLAGLFAVLVVTRKWKLVGTFVISMTITSIAFLPLVVANARSQFLARTSMYLETSSTIETIRILWHHAITFLYPADFHGEGTASFEVIRVWVARIAVAALLVMVYKYRGRLQQRTQFLGLIAFVAFACFFVVAFFLTPAYIALRHSTPLFVPCVLLVASICCDVFTEIAERTTKIATLFGGLLVLASFSYSLATMHPNSTKRGDWARVGAFLEQHESPGQPIIVFTTFDALALPYHYHGVNRILPDERFFDFDQEAAFGAPDSLKRQTDFVISEIPTEAAQIWLAVNEKCLVTEACVPLENFIEANYTIEKEQQFYLEKVFLLRKKGQ